MVTSACEELPASPGGYRHEVVPGVFSPALGLPIAAPRSSAISARVMNEQAEECRAGALDDVPTARGKGWPGIGALGVLSVGTPAERSGWGGVLDRPQAAIRVHAAIADTIDLARVDLMNSGPLCNSSTDAPAPIATIALGRTRRRWRCRRTARRQSAFGVLTR